MSVLHLVIAHHLEARPLIELFSLHRDSGHTEFETYTGADDIVLVIAGMGKAQAAAATRYLAQRLDPGEQGAWLNIGIAGHRSLPVGSTLVANKIIDAETGEAGFPAMLVPGPASGCVVTVAQAELNYPQEAAYDMEASGFWQVAAAAGTLELVQVFKLISDNPEHPTHRVDKPLIARLFADNLPVIQRFARALQALADDYNRPRKEPPAYQQLLAQAHFSVTQRHQLKRLCQRLQALGLDGQLPDLACCGHASARQLLQALEALLSGSEQPAGPAGTGSGE